MLMRGGTSKGAYFLRRRPAVRPGRARTTCCCASWGRPDPRQIDGIGGAHPLTSKVAVVVRRPRDPDADVDYLFLQVGVEEPTVSDRQNCGNLLAGVGPFAVERGLVPAGGDRTTVRVRMVNSGSVATATFPTPGGVVAYDGDTAHLRGARHRRRRPARLRGDRRVGLRRAAAHRPRPRRRSTASRSPASTTGCPSVVVAAADLGVTGVREPAELEADARSRDRVQALRLRGRAS